MSLLSRLFLLVLLAMLPAIGIQLYNELVVRRQNEAAVREDAKRILQLVASEQQRAVTGVRQLLEALAETDAVRARDASQCQAHLDRLVVRSSEWRHVHITDEQGVVFCSSEPAILGASLADSSFFHAAMTKGGFITGDYARRLTGSPGLPFAVPYSHPSGERAGVVSLTLELPQVQKELGTKSLPLNTLLTMADRNGSIIAQFPAGRAELGTPLPERFWPLLGASTPGVVDMRGLDGAERIVAYAPLSSEPEGLFLVVGIDKKTAMRQIDLTTGRGVALIALGLTAALAGAWLGGRFFVRTPAEQLLDAASRWRLGDYAARTALDGAPPEFRGLGSAFNRMAAAVQEREQREHDASAKARKMAAVLDSITDGVYELDRDWRFTFVNDTAEAHLAVEQDLTGAVLWEVFPGTIGTEFEATLRSAMADQQPVTLEAYYAPREAWHAIRAFPSKSGLVVYFQDVTERKRAAEQSEAQEARYRAIVETAVDPIVVIDTRGIVQSFNGAAERTFGYTAAEAIGQNVKLLMPEPHRHAHDGYLADYQRTGRRRIIGIGREVEGQRKDGSTFPLELSVAEWRAGSKTLFTGIMRDISERKRAEGERARLLDELEAQRARLEAVLRHLPVGVMIGEAPSGRVVLGNEQVARILRHPYRPAEGVDGYQFQGLYPDGRAYEPQDWPLARAIANGETVIGEEIRLLRGDGSMAALSVSATPIRDSDGATVAGVMVLDDITDRKHGEEQQRLLMGELDHRVKNTLATIQSMIVQTARDRGSVQDFAAVLQGRVGAMARAQSLLTQSRWDGAALRDVVEEELLPYGQERITVSGENLRLKPKAALALSMVLHELTTNAAKYGALSTPAGQVDVTWRPQRVATGRDLVLAWTERNGPAVSAPKRRGFGSALIQRTLSYEFGGSTEIDFAPEGLRCEVRVPLHRVMLEEIVQPVLPATKATKARLSTRELAGRRILVVEDAMLLGLYIETILDAAGMTVVGPATSLDQALRMARDESYDAAILDVNLDGDRVFPVADALARRGLPFVFATGYDGETGLPEAYRNFPAIQKPFAANALLEAVAGLLPRREAA